MYNRAIKRSLPQRPTPVPALLGYRRGGQTAAHEEAMRQSLDVVTLGVTNTLKYHARLKRTFWWRLIHPDFDPVSAMVARLEAVLAEKPGRTQDDLRARMLFELRLYWRWHDAEVHRVARDWERVAHGKRVGQDGGGAVALQAADQAAGQAGGGGDAVD